MSQLKKNIIEKDGTLVKLKPGKYLKSKHKSASNNFLELKESKEALILENIGSHNGALARSAYLSLLESELVIVWQDQFEKIK